MDHSSIIEKLQTLRPNSTFLSITDYTNNQNELADYNIVFHVSYESLLKRSVDKLIQYQPKNDIELQAKRELLTSYTNSLKKLETSDIDQVSDGYRHFYDDSGRMIKGVKLHEETDVLHLYGLVVHKKVKQSATSTKKTNSKDLTLAKNKIVNTLPISKWRQFKIQPDRVAKIAVENINLLQEDIV